MDASRVRALEEVGSVLVVAVICLLLPLLLREHVPSSWPRSVLWVAPLAFVGAFVVVEGGGSGNLLKFAGSDPLMVLVVLAAGLGTLGLVRAGGGSWPRALWFGGCVLLIGVTTLPSASGPPHLTSDPVGAIWYCVGDREHWLPPGLSQVRASQVTSELIPNIALFMPLGAGLVLQLADRREDPLATRRGRVGIVLLPLLVSVGIESYQALFTTRVCAPIDVMANTAGGALGGLVVGAVLVALRRRAAHRGAGRGPAVE